MSEIIGVDLGTTFSGVAQVREGVPRILPHGDERIMPSVVGLTPQDTLLVGTPARNQYLLYPERTVRSSHGNTQLGGDDFDQALVDFLAERFQREHDVDPRTDRRALARLTRTAEAAKITLSSEPFARVREEYLLTEGGRPLHLDVEVSRAEFEGLIGSLLEGTLQSLDAALQDAGITARDLSRILFVGGSTRIPLVYEMVYDHTSIEPETAINPDEAVALGAAVQAALIAGEPLQ